MSDLVLQSPGLGAAAVEAFAQALVPAAVRRRDGAARLLDVEDSARTRGRAAELARDWQCDVAFVTPALRAGALRVLALDMDSTVITIECIDELARLAGRGAEVAAITEAAMHGEIPDYTQSLRRRVALLAGAEAALVPRVIAERLQFSPGAQRLVARARALGWRSLLVSGGFTAFTAHVCQALGIDEACSNDLVVRDGRLTGEVVGPAQSGGAIVDAAGKAAALQRLCARLGCSPAQAVVVGDGANDLAMMAQAGLAVAFRAKPAVQRAAHYSLNHAGLDGILELLADQW